MLDDNLNFLATEFEDLRATEWCEGDFDDDSDEFVYDDRPDAWGV